MSKFARYPRLNPTGIGKKRVRRPIWLEKSSGLPMADACGEAAKLLTEKCCRATVSSA